MVTPEFAEILGLLCAEGSHIVACSSYWGKDRGKDRFYKNQKSERIEFTNMDEKLLDHYRRLLLLEFDSIMISNQKVKTAFIRGYFDGDGTCSKGIRFFSTNKSGLTQVLELLKNLDFKSYFEKPMIKSNRKPSYSIRIPEAERKRFLNTIQPVSKRPGTRGLF